MKQYKYKINGNIYNVTVDEIDDRLVKVEVNGTPYKVELENSLKPKKPVIRPAAAPRTASGDPVVTKPTQKPKARGVKSPLPGVVLDIKVKEGEMVKRGQVVVILEAMKMENNINADRDGKVVAVKVSKGESVLEGTDLIIIE